MPHSDKTYMDSLALNNYECLRLLQYLNGRIEGHTAATRADDRFLCNLFEECVTQEGLRPLYYSADSNATLLPTAQAVPLLCSTREGSWLAAALQKPQAKALLGEALCSKLSQLLPSPEQAPLRAALHDHSECRVTSLPDLKEPFEFFVDCICEKKYFSATNATNTGERILKGRAYYIQYDRLLGAFYLIGWSTEHQTTFLARLDRLRDYRVICPDGLFAPDDLDSHYAAQRRSMKVLIENRRNAAYRFCGMFAGYERHARFHPEQGLLELTLYYYEFETDRMIRRLLTMGSSVHVTEPPELRQLLYQAACDALQNE